MKARTTNKAATLGILMLDVKQVATLCNLGVSTIWKLAKDSEHTGFPRPVMLGARTARWVAADIKAWVNGLRERAA